MSEDQKPKYSTQTSYGEISKALSAPYVDMDLTYVQEKLVGVKNDQEKPDMTDIPKEAMWEMGKAFTYGQKKYGKNNYRNGMLASRQLAAAIRHIYQHLDGQTLDDESGISHLGHALASIAMACYTVKHYPDMDNRFDKDLKKHEGGDGK